MNINDIYIGNTYQFKEINKINDLIAQLEIVNSTPVLMYIDSNNYFDIIKEVYVSPAPVCQKGFNIYAYAGQINPNIDYLDIQNEHLMKFKDLLSIIRFKTKQKDFTREELINVIKTDEFTEKIFLGGVKYEKSI